MSQADWFWVSMAVAPGFPVGMGLFAFLGWVTRRRADAALWWLAVWGFGFYGYQVAKRLVRGESAVGTLVEMLFTVAAFAGALVASRRRE